MPKDRQKVRENKKRYQGLKRGTFKHRPTVRIPDPTYDAIFHRDKESYGKGCPSEQRLGEWHGPLTSALKERELELARKRESKNAD